MSSVALSVLDLSVVIVSWNTRELLHGCLESLYRDLDSTPELHAEVWVVDNASSDGSAEMVRTRYPRAHLMENQENTGFSRANNQAIPECRGRWVCLLNSDTIVQPCAFSTLLKAADAAPEVGVAGPLLLNEDGTIQHSWSRFVGPLAEFLGKHDRSEAPTNLSEAAAPPDMSLPPIPVGWVGGACMLARAEAIERVGLLDEGYFMYCEEMDWCRRFRLAGWEILLVPDARVVHLGGRSSRQVSRATRERLAASKVRYYRRHGRRWDFWQAQILRALYLRRS